MFEHLIQTSLSHTSFPYEVTGTLREYQMLGLSWLVKCYDHGINAILADEMVSMCGWGKNKGTTTSSCGG